MSRIQSNPLKGMGFSGSEGTKCRLVWKVQLPLLGYTSALKMQTGKKINSVTLQSSMLASTNWRRARRGLRIVVVLVLEKNTKPTVGNR